MTSKALSTRIRIRLYPQTFCCGYKTLRVHTYPDLLRFRPSTCIRIRSEFDTRMFESLIEHALMNKLRRLPWQRSTWVGSFRTFICVIVFQSLWLQASTRNRIRFHSGERFQKFAATVCVFAGHVWTKAKSVTKCLRIRTNPDTCGQGPSEISFKNICNGVIKLSNDVDS